MGDVSGVVLVTGCSSGIGKATALRLVKGGAVVYASARKTADLAELEAAGCRTLALDVTDAASMQAAVATIERDAGVVGVLVNNAGYSQSGAVESLPMDKVRRQFETNVFGLLRMCQLVLPGMRAQRQGRIVNIGSMGGVFTFPGGGAYHATKHALEALSDALRFEVAGFGIGVSLVQPGIIKTGFAEAVAHGLADDAEGPYREFNTSVVKATANAYAGGPLARLGGVPDDVAAVVEKAIRARNPRARYPVTWSATALMSLRRWAPEAAWDAFLRGSFPRPS